MKFTFLVAALAMVVAAESAPPATGNKQAVKAAKAAAKATKLQRKADEAKKAAEATKAPAAAAPAAAAPAAPAKKRIHNRKYDELTPASRREDIQDGIYAWNNDNSKYRQKPPALPKSFGLHMKPYVSKNTHHRIIEKAASKKNTRIPQFPHHTHATSKRVTFRRSDLDRRAINVQEICNGYSNQKERDACQKRYGVYTEKTHQHYKAGIEAARQRCDHIKQANRRRMCHNTFLRKGTVPYFAQQEENEDVEDKEQDEAVDADEEDDSGSESDAKGLMQVAAREDDDDIEDDDESSGDDDDKGLMQLLEDDEDDEDEDDDESEDDE